jgi:hypothetical protein
VRPARARAGKVGTPARRGRIHAAALSELRLKPIARHCERSEAIRNLAAEPGRVLISSHDVRRFAPITAAFDFFA